MAYKATNITTSPNYRGPPIDKARTAVAGTDAMVSAFVQTEIPGGNFHKDTWSIDWLDTQMLVNLILTTKSFP